MMMHDEFLAAEAFGNQAIENAIQCGKSLLRARDLCCCLEEWEDMLSEKGLTSEWAERFMAIASLDHVTLEDIADLYEEKS